MSRDVARTPSPPPANANAGTNSAQGNSFFLRERERLVGEIAESMGQILNHSNALNRKLEESILVGKGFEPMSVLWGRFASMMGQYGVVPGDVNAQQQQQQHYQGQDVAGEEGYKDRAQDAVGADEGGADAARPANPIAPGGGTWTTSHTNTS
ncbi:unnamed protein product [Jaminaea pallidilutea]